PARDRRPPAGADRARLGHDHPGGQPAARGAQDDGAPDEAGRLREDALAARHAGDGRGARNAGRAGPDPPSRLEEEGQVEAQGEGHLGLVAELLAYLARELVDEPEAVRVETEEREGALVLRLYVAADDVGKVIGRGGRIVRALRTVVRASAVREGRRVLVEIA